jgi:hypothetical protein
VVTIWEREGNSYKYFHYKIIFFSNTAGESSISSDGTDRRVSRQPPHGHHSDRDVPLSGRASSAHSGQVSVSPAYFTAPKCGQPKKQRRTPISMHDNTSLTRNMSRGNRAYLHSIAQVYDVSKEKQYKQYQYKALVIKEFLKGTLTIIYIKPNIYKVTRTGFKTISLRSNRL